jgi:hypothetical protein
MADASWKEKLKGGFDLVFLFGRGIKPFEIGGKKEALRSLWIPVFFFPLSLLSAWLYPPQGLEDQPASTVLAIIAESSVVMFFAGWALLWLFAVVMERRDRFWVTFHAGNWIGIPMSIISLPFLMLAIMEVYPRAQMDRVLTIITYYGVVVGACIAFRGLKIGWEWAGFFSCMGVFISQQIWNLAFWANGVPIKWT